MYVLSRLICKNIDIHVMQFKILHRYIPTNDLLLYINEEHPNVNMLLYADDIVIVGDQVNRV